MVADEILDECDRQGMLVMDENRHLGDTYNSNSAPGTPATDLSDLKELVMRDRNHPSVIMWSMCNEEYIQGSEEGARIFKAMMDVVHRYDKTRPVTCAMNGGFGQGISLVEDLQGINYHTDAYAPFHTSHPNMPVYGSEIGSTVTARGVYVQDDKAGLVSAYSLPWFTSVEDAWAPIGSATWMAGGFVWTGFDYKGEPTPFQWPDVNSNFGLMDEAGFPKDDYYYYKAWWDSKPLVHVFPHWNAPADPSKPERVYCYGNTAKVELFLNGKSLGAQDMPPFRHVEWSVPWEAGTLTVKGYDTAGNVVATEIHETTGEPAALRLSTDRTRLTADREDVTMVRVSVVDSQGRVVPTADNAVHFTVRGAGYVAGTGNGDPTSHEPDRGADRKAFNGYCLVLVGATEKPGPITLTATSPGLASAKISMTSGR